VGEDAEATGRLGSRVKVVVMGMVVVEILKYVPIPEIWLLVLTFT